MKNSVVTEPIDIILCITMSITYYNTHNMQYT